MIHYVLQIITFQLLALLVYDFFLKKETFFQWNRIYLLTTSLLSFGIPFIKLESFKTVLPQEYVILLPEVIVGNPIVNELPTSSSNELTVWELLILLGCVISLFIFIFKIYKIYKLKSNNDTIDRNGYIEIIIKNSTSAFSFFKNVFLGDKVLEKEHAHIIKHELIHVKQYHSLDLLFFELLKIVMWFNPLIYVYQKRVSELHEFIADAKVAKNNKSEHYQKLLSEVFKTERISFINQFFNSSLIKKRIVMLQKSKSKNVWQFKYLLIIPLVIGMLIYTSCERESQELIIEDSSQALELNIENSIKELQRAIIEGELTSEQREKMYLEILKLREMLAVSSDKASVITGYKSIDELEKIPFSVIDEVPIFPGCENETDRRACFRQKINKHIRKNFRYPAEAQDKGIQGRVYIQFIIDKEGNITNIKKRGPSTLLEDEAVRIINRLPKMIPGKQKGQAAGVPFAIPITFKLQ